MSPYRYDLPEEVKTLEQAIEWLDAQMEKERNSPHKCPRCHAPSFTWTELMRVEEISVVEEFTHEEIMSAIKRIDRKKAKV
jgi:hypothetical protein